MPDGTMMKDSDMKKKSGYMYGGMAKKKISGYVHGGSVQKANCGASMEATQKGTNTKKKKGPSGT